jgi:hypothetical protein
MHGIGGSTSLIKRREDQQAEKRFCDSNSLIKIVGIFWVALVAHDPFAHAQTPVLSVRGVDAEEFERVVNVSVLNQGKTALCRDLSEGIALCDQEIVNHADCDKGDELIEAYDAHEPSRIAKVRDRLFKGYMPENEHARNLHFFLKCIDSNQRRLSCPPYRPIAKLQKRPGCNSRYKSSAIHKKTQNLGISTEILGEGS